MHPQTAARKQQVNELNDCLCRKVVQPLEDNVLICKQAGCETGQYHLGCIGLEQLPPNWVCAACEVSGRGRGGKRVCR
ncbi:hypothetical protein CVT25_000252 [Psilocybe cyanescens]|uniref:Zinc finger PHD-type domain-containing protein n=1 Tax=Psilocybe cyanescens TaxID=93625 RepID=A0A409XW76_PSICY|nr:hypothetical protein CVT25_000252 [Psilocybe cyanescens]